LCPNDSSRPSAVRGGEEPVRVLPFLIFPLSVLLLSFLATFGAPAWAQIAPSAPPGGPTSTEPATPAEPAQPQTQPAQPQTQPIPGQTPGSSQPQGQQPSTLPTTPLFIPPVAPQYPPGFQQPGAQQPRPFGQPFGQPQIQPPGGVGPGFPGPGGVAPGTVGPGGQAPGEAGAGTWIPPGPPPPSQVFFPGALPPVAGTLTGGGKLFEFHPTLSLTETWYDNFNLTSSGKGQENYRTTLGLGTNLLINGALTRGGISGSSGITYDTASGSQGVNYFPTINGFITHIVNPRLTLTATDSYTRSDEPAQADPFGLRQQRQKFWSNSLSLSAAWLLDLVATQTYYSNSIFSSGSTETISNVIGTSASTRLGASNTVSVGYQFSYSNTTGNNSNTSTTGGSTTGHSTGNTIFGSFSRQLSQYTTAGVSSSYTWLSGDNARIWNVSLFSSYGLPSGLSMSSSLGYSMASSDTAKDSSGVTSNSFISYRFVRASISLGVFNDFRQTAVQGQNFGIVQTTGFTGNFSYSLTPFITTNAFATYTTNDFTGIGNSSSTPSSNTFTTGAGLNWQLLRWLSMSLQYTHTVRSQGSNSVTGSGNGNISENQASIGFFAGF
jgi:hypothetical protein